MSSQTSPTAENTAGASPNAAAPKKNSRGMMLRVLVIVVVLAIIGWAL